MTVVPDDGPLMKLICDDCGDEISGPTCLLPDAEVVWTFVSDHGWTGSPFATGPHRCPRCGLGPSGLAGGGVRPDGEDPLGLDHLDHVPPGATEDDGSDGADALVTALTGAVEVGDRLLVDLAPVEQIDSAGLGLLVRAHQDARRRGRTLCLVAPSRFVRTVLHTMRLDGLFPTFDSRGTAAEFRPFPRAGTPAASAERHHEEHS